MKPLCHLAIIPDGNRRWARERGLPTLVGHRRGFDMAVKLGRAAWDLGIHTLTLWAFSTENWQRTKKEIGYLMNLYQSMVDKYLQEAHKNKVKIVHLGRKDRIPQILLKKITKAEKETEKHQDHILNIALDYGGRDEVLRAIKRLPDTTKLTEKRFGQLLDTANQPHPDPDLIIRTSGEQRLSGFLIWQAVYAELYFEPSYFPAFGPAKLKKAVAEYNRRQRRFGK